MLGVAASSPGAWPSAHARPPSAQRALHGLPALPVSRLSLSLGSQLGHLPASLHRVAGLSYLAKGVGSHDWLPPGADTAPTGHGGLDIGEGVLSVHVLLGTYIQLGTWEACSSRLSFLIYEMGLPS